MNSSHRKKLNILIYVLCTVGAAEEAAAGGEGTPQREEEAETLSRTPEQRSWERMGERKRKRKRSLLKRDTTIFNLRSNVALTFFSSSNLLPVVGEMKSGCKTRKKGSY